MTSLEVEGKERGEGGADGQGAGIAAVRVLPCSVDCVAECEVRGDPCEDLLAPKWLDDIVVTSALEAFDDVSLVTLQALRERENRERGKGESGLLSVLLDSHECLFTFAETIRIGTQLAPSISLSFLHTS